MSIHESPLELAHRHVREAQQRITKQRQRILELQRDGHDTSSAEGLLATFEQTLTLMRNHLAEEERLDGGR